MAEKLKLDQLGRIGVEEFRAAPKIPLVVILDDVRSMHNVGAVFRTSDAFLLTEVILCGITPQPPHREIHKAALGATESVTWSYEKDVVTAIQKIRSQNFKVFAIEQTTESIELQNFEMDVTEKYAVVFGNEVEGVSDKALENCDGSIEIPQLGTKHSLNVSVCAGIVMWDFFRRLQLR